MPKPKKIQYNGDSKVIAALANVGNWLLDNALSAIPIASSNSLGGIKVGQNLTIENDGTLNAQAGGSDVSVTPILSSGTKIAEISVTEGTGTDSYDIYAPTPSTVYNSTINIKKNGTDVGSFTLNQSSGENINISVPTKTSDLTNDSGFITSYTDEKITAEEKNPTSEKTYNIPFTDGTTNQKPFINDGIKFRTLQGTSGSSGIANLALGNDIASGTAGNKYGNLRIYSRSQYFMNVIPVNNLTANRTFTLPDKSGTAATTDDIPTITDAYDGTSSDGMSGKAVKSAIDALDGTITGSAGAGKTLTAFSQTDGKVSATFADISITKSQISDFPTIPTVYNSTITIKKNGTTVDSFTLNQSSGKNIDISVPTKTSDLTNDSGFITSYTDEKITGATKNPTSTSSYNILFTNSTTNQKPYINNGIKYSTLEGTASAAGSSEIVLGNSTATGTAGNKTGSLAIYAEKSGYVRLKATATSTSGRTITFPDNGGTVALTTDSMTPKSHTHGNIQNGGTLQTTDVAIASGDKLVICDSSDSNKIARSSLAFGTGTSKFLREDGTWQTVTATWNGGEVSSSVYPNTSNSINIGSTTKLFANGYIGSLYLGKYEETSGYLVFRKSNYNYQTTIQMPTAPTGTRTLYLPDAGGTLLCNGITGQFYTAQWKATSGTSNTKLTEELELPKGKYFVHAQGPGTATANSVMNLSVTSGSVTFPATYCLALMTTGYTQFTCSIEVTSTTAKVCLTQGSSASATYGYIDRGYLRCIRLS